MMILKDSKVNTSLKGNVAIVYDDIERFEGKYIFKRECSYRVKKIKKNGA